MLWLVGCGPGSVADGGVDGGPDGSIADAGDGDAGSMDAGPTDAGEQDAGQNDAGTSSCSGFVTDAGEIAQMFVRGITPIGTGGTIVDGVYDLTSWSVYTGSVGGSGPTGLVASATMVVSGGTYRYSELARDGDAGIVLDTSGTIVTPDGGALVAEQLCPPGQQPFSSYSTDGTDLVLYSLSPPWGFTLRRR